MSYSTAFPCFDCVKNDKCVDAQIVAGAVSTIHNIGFEKGHLGGGHIEMTCCHKVEKEKKA